jgi:hypothetical protein
MRNSLDFERLLGAQYTATFRRIMLLFAHESTPEMGFAAAKRPDNKAARVRNENGRALPGRKLHMPNN